MVSGVFLCGASALCIICAAGGVCQCEVSAWGNGCGKPNICVWCLSSGFFFSEWCSSV